MKISFSPVTLLLSTALLPIATSGQAATKATETAASSVENEIIVIGEKTSRTLRETASSVTVLSEEELGQIPSVFSANGLLDHIPNISTVEPGNEAPTIRGVDGTGPAAGADAFLAGTRPRLTYQIDGRTLGFNESLFQNASLWDIEQVEIYRGPQSTVQGRNSIAGAISIKAAGPSFIWQGKARGIVGEDGRYIASAAIGGPVVSDVLAFRLSADYQTSNAVVDMTAYPEEGDPEEYRSLNLRGKLLLEPSDSFRSLLTLGFTDGKAPQAEYVIRPFTDRTARFPLQPTFRSRNSYAIWDTGVQLSDLISLNLNASYTDFSTDRATPAGTGNVRIDGDELVIQPIIRLGTPSDQISGFVAGYFFRSDQDESIDLAGGGTFRDETENNAILGEVTVRASALLSFTLGGRYEEEKRLRIGNTGPFGVDFDETYSEFLPNATIALNLSDEWTVGGRIARGYNGGGAGITFAPPFLEYTYDSEFVTNFEGFTRGNMLDGKLRLTSNVFYNKYEGLQLPFSLGVNVTVIRNAEKASTYGAEAGLSYEFTPENSVYVNFGLLQTNIDEYSDINVEGSDLERSPAFTFDAGFTVSPVENLVLNGNLRFSDSYYSDATNTARGKVDAYAIANAQIAYNVGETARIFLSASNLFNSNAPLAIVTGASEADDYALIARPRSLSAGVELSF